MRAPGARSGSVEALRLNETAIDCYNSPAQLAHLDKNRVRAIYNRAEYIEKRRNMMQAWSDYLDGLKSDKKAIVTALRS